MTIADWLFKTMQKLGEAGVDSPRRDALVLLEDTIQKNRAWVLAHPEYEMGEAGLKTLESLIARRIQREPLAYIRGKAWFYKRFFTVNPNVMIPRPESETFINLLKQIVEDRRWKTEDGWKIVDVGTGSGCLAITAKLELPNADVTAIDLSKKALGIAKRNAKKYKVQIKFLNRSFLEALPPSTFHLLPSMIMANLPYVPEGYITSPEIVQEPPEALFSGKDGLDHYRKFWLEVADLDSKPQYILTESLEDQHQAAAELAEQAGYKLEKTDILVQLFARSG